MIETPPPLVESPVSLIDRQIDSSLYTPYSDIELPKVILGFVIKNVYDQERLRIKSILQPKNILHHYGDDGRHVPIHFHGIELTPSGKVTHLCSVIHNAQPINIQSYKNILKYNNLTCSGCSGYMKDGVYPIDIRCLSSLSTNRFKSNYLYLRSLLDTNDSLPWFSSWSNFNIFMLCPSTLCS